jgi:hypothetical protein
MPSMAVGARPDFEAKTGTRFPEQAASRHASHGQSFPNGNVVLFFFLSSLHPGG